MVCTRNSTDVAYGLDLVRQQELRYLRSVRDSSFPKQWLV